MAWSLQVRAACLPAHTVGRYPASCSVQQSRSWIAGWSSAIRIWGTTGTASALGMVDGPLPLSKFPVVIVLAFFFLKRAHHTFLCKARSPTQEPLPVFSLASAGASAG